MLLVPLLVVTPERMVMGDGPTTSDHRIGGDILDGLPLLDKLAQRSFGVKTKIRGRAIGVGMGEPA